MQNNTLSLYHLVRPPKIQSDKQKAPLMVLLHGYGSDENDLFSFASELPDQYYILSVRAPYPMQPFGNAWYAIQWEADNSKFTDLEQAKSSLSRLLDFLEEAKETYPVDADNVTLLGFSQGAILSYALALNHPEKVTNLIALSGYVLRELLTENPEKEAYKHLNVYAAHGTVDQVIPVEWARKTKPLLDEYGITNTYMEFPIGHGVSPESFQAMATWLQVHAK